LKYFYKENPILEAKINSFFSELSVYNDTFFNGVLSIILLGSLSRGEATWLDSDSGPVMVSDIEFFAVYPEGFSDLSKFSSFINDTAEKVFAEQKSNLFHIDYTFVCRQRLPNMERKLLTYDAKQMGKCAMGQNDIGLIPEITLENINLWDIRDILTHRVFSVLYYGMPLKQQGKLEQYRYNLAKNSLDLMTVLLATHHRLESGFINRMSVIEQLPLSQKIKDYFSYCLSLKLRSESNASYTLEEMEECFLELLKNLAGTMKVPFSNTWLNRKYIIRRLLGICKRSVRYKHLPNIRHLTALIRRFENQKTLTEKDLKNNLVLNGYPLKGEKG